MNLGGLNVKKKEKKTSKRDSNLDLLLFLCSPVRHPISLFSVSASLYWCILSHSHSTSLPDFLSFFLFSLTLPLTPPFFSIRLLLAFPFLTLLPSHSFPISFLFSHYLSDFLFLPSPLPSLYFYLSPSLTFMDFLSVSLLVVFFLRICVCLFVSPPPSFICISISLSLVDSSMFVYLPTRNY